MSKLKELRETRGQLVADARKILDISLIHISAPTRLSRIS